MKEARRGEKSYQGAALKNVGPATQENLKQDALHDLNRLDEKMRNCCGHYSSSLTLSHGQSVPVSVPRLSLTVITKTRLMTMAMTAA